MSDWSLRGLRLSDHLSALRAFGRLYSRPERVWESLADLPVGRALTAGMILLLHAIPYLLLADIILLVGDWLWNGRSTETATIDGLAFLQRQAEYLSAGIACGVVFGGAFALAFGLAGRAGTQLRPGLASGMTVGAAVAVAGAIISLVPGALVGGAVFWAVVGAATGLAVATAYAVAAWACTELTSRSALPTACGIVFGISIAMIAALAYRSGMAFIIALVNGAAIGAGFGWIVAAAEGVAVPAPAGLAMALAMGGAIAVGFGIMPGLVVAACFYVSALRLYYWPVHFLYVWPTVRAQHYVRHPVAWDALCGTGFPALDLVLVRLAEQEPQVGSREIERLIYSYPTQRLSALRARVRLLARAAARQSDLAVLEDFVANLPEGPRGFLADTSRLRNMVSDLVAQQTQVRSTRAALREPKAQLLHMQIENFARAVRGLHEPLATEFGAAARQWLAVAERQWRDAQAALARMPTQQVFRAGDPVDRAQEAFIPRAAVTDEVERQLMLATGCPGLILYGRRRTGKTTILRNLDHALPEGVCVAVISMQDPEAFSSLTYFARRIARAVATAWPDDAPADPQELDLAGVFARLERANARLLAEDRRLLLALDEYEMIDHKIGEAVFSQDLLATLRESIQRHRRIVWIFAGSHDITELTHASWTSYLVSARTIEVPLFIEDETRALLTDPLRYSPLWRQDDPNRPRFTAALWGYNGIERIHAESGGWPHLVQLIAETVVDLLNEARRDRADDALLERAFDKAIVSGDTVLRELLERDCQYPGEWEYLRGFRLLDAQPPPEDEVIRRALRRRLLVAESAGAWRLSVPLMRRWLYARA